MNAIEESLRYAHEQYRLYGENTPVYSHPPDGKVCLVTSFINLKNKWDVLNTLLAVHGNCSTYSLVRFNANSTKEEVLEFIQSSIDYAHEQRI